MIAALAAEDVLAADETPVNVLDKAPVPAAADEADPEEKDGKDPAGAPHVLIVTTPDGRLRFLQALGSRRKGSVGVFQRTFERLCGVLHFAHVETNDRRLVFFTQRRQQ